MNALSKYRSLVILVGSAILASGVLLAVVPLFAQESGPSGAQVAAFGAVFLVMIVIFLAIYVYFALALQTIAKKTNTENPWLAWIPIANLILMVNIAKKPMWWVLMCFIPLVNIVFSVMLFMAIAEARGKPSWWGILMIVPVANLIVPGYLAWSD
jgi:hypothetical protein